MDPVADGADSARGRGERARGGQGWYRVHWRPALRGAAHEGEAALTATQSTRASASSSGEGGAPRKLNAPIGAALAADGGETHPAQRQRTRHAVLCWWLAVALCVLTQMERPARPLACAPRQVPMPASAPALVPAPTTLKRPRPNLSPSPPSQKHQCSRPSPHWRNSAARARRRAAP